mmetsp:Transcript_63245/g.206376  ORF Transcript_63245/g.206376 Transcript_63245/m.206376 type:complete len:219 (-) Transcript_63245:104-760(-)
MAAILVDVLLDLKCQGRAPRVQFGDLAAHHRVLQVRAGVAELLKHDLRQTVLFRGLCGVLGCGKARVEVRSHVCPGPHVLQPLLCRARRGSGLRIATHERRHRELSAYQRRMAVCIGQAPESGIEELSANQLRVRFQQALQAAFIILHNRFHTSADVSRFSREGQLVDTQERCVAAAASHSDAFPWKTRQRTPDRAASQQCTQGVACNHTFLPNRCGR